MNDEIIKVVYILVTPLEDIFFNRFGVAHMISNGIDVEIWDLTDFFNRKVTRKNATVENTNFKKYRKFDNKHDIKCALLGLPPNAVVNVMAMTLQSFFIYKLLSGLKIKYCVFQMASHPNLGTGAEKGTLVRIISIVKRAISLKPKHIFVALCNKILLKYYQILGVKVVDFAVLSGERSLEINQYPTDATTHLIWAHHWDYDIYLNERDNLVVSDPSVGVFLDECYPTHSDLDYLGIVSPIGSEEYYSKLRMFFNFLEKNHHVRIIIAAHPRSNYKERSSCFGGRTVIKGQTGRLVHESSFVIAHDSTSVNYAVLFRKPIVFITMDKMTNCKTGRLTTGLNIEAMATALHKTPINLDSFADFEWDREILVDAPFYSRYQNDIIKKNGTLEIPFWEIYINALREVDRK